MTNGITYLGYISCKVGLLLSTEVISKARHFLSGGKKIQRQSQGVTNKNRFSYESEDNPRNRKTRPTCYGCKYSVCSVPIAEGVRGRGRGRGRGRKTKVMAESDGKRQTHNGDDNMLLPTGADMAIHKAVRGTGSFFLFSSSFFLAGEN